MRDLLDTLNQLIEGSNLAPSEFIGRQQRFDTFIAKIKAKSPFTTVTGTEVTIDPREAKRFTDLIGQNEFKGSIKAKTTAGGEIPLSQLAKTKEFGGSAVAAGENPEEAGKESLLVKPSSIKITDYDIPASDFYETLVNNPVLNSTEYGKVIIQLAQYIISGELVYLPEEYQGTEKQKIRKAIVDYAGEYLGVLALLYDRTRFPKKQQFLAWLGGSTDELVLHFPGKANTNIADSYATITNRKSSHSLNISSKGTGGGAAPAISGLKISDDLRTNPALKNAIKFIDLCKAGDVKGAGPSTITQAFDVLDFIHSINPKSIGKEWHKFLPFNTKSSDLMGLCIKSINAGKQRTELKLPAKYKNIIDTVKSNASDGGKVVYAIKKEVANAINNNGAIPEFAGAILQVLEMNFMQQYTDYAQGQLTFATQWPAKLDGVVTVENKSTANDPTAGGFSFKLGRTDDDVSSEFGEPEVDDSPALPDVADVAKDIVNPKSTRKAEKTKGITRDREPNIGRAERR